MNKELESISWIDEIQTQEFDEDMFGACSINTFSLSDYWGNKGSWCTLTHECMAWCK